jgi:CopG family transcriptional regulator/antitoxin EndoAI
MRTSKVLSLSLPPELFRAAQRTARREGRTRSELFREALRRYIREQKWRDLREYGERRAARRGLKSPDVESAIEQYRRGE